MKAYAIKIGKKVPTTYSDFVHHDDGVSEAIAAVSTFNLATEFWSETMADADESVVGCFPVYSIFEVEIVLGQAHSPGMTQCYGPVRVLE